jgi:hypothetical protein
LVFASSFFSAAFSGAGAASFAGSAAGAAGAGSAGAAGGGGGGGGAGSSFLPQPANVRVKANRVIADNDTKFFPIFDSPPFPSHIFTTQFLLINFYCISPLEIQAEVLPKSRPYAANSRIIRHLDAHGLILATEITFAAKSI